MATVLSRSPSSASRSTPASHPAPASRKRGRHSYHPHEIADFLSNCDRLSGDVAGVPRRHWWRAILLLAWTTGLRTGSLLRMKVRDIDRDGRQLRIRGEHRPPIALTDETIAAIDAIAEPARDLLFPWPGSREEFANECSDLLDGSLPDVPGQE